MIEHLHTPQGRSIAYQIQPGQGPGIVFLGGFRSDMSGTKAAYLADWCRDRGRAFLRFDYSGHGASGGEFLTSGIGDWFADALAVISALTRGPQVMVGSSMGGWIALLVARERPDLVHGLVGVAAAPDFTTGMLANLTPDQAQSLAGQGHFTEPSDYDPAGYPITRALLTQGAQKLVLQGPLELPFPVRLLQGTADTDVGPDVSLRILDHADSPDLRLILVKGADHRFSTAACLALIGQAVDEVSVA